MRLLLISDTQTDFHNLDLCEIAMQEVLASTVKYKPDAVVHCGDAKEAYNPVDTRVVQFWVRWVRRIKEVGFRFIFLLGNHDRISQSKESKNWLDILRAAGAEIVTQPKVKKIAEVDVAFLPYTGDKELEKVWARELVRTVEPGNAVLIFHTEVQGGVLNASGVETAGYQPTALSMGYYEACFGGHIHVHQRIGKNVWYVGSPFCQDWSEANQSKGHILVDVSPPKVRVSQIKTKIPGWYDVDWLKANSIEPEAGAYIRSRVLVTSKKLSQQLKDEEERLRKKYKAEGLRFFVVPKVQQDEEQEIKLEGLTDADKISAYVSATWPSDAKSMVSAAVGYLTSKLSTVRLSPRYGAPLRFKSVEAENVLTFQKVRVPYSKQGLVMLQGENKDWPGQSNGAGKTNTLSLLPVALFGETLKGQKADAWSNERIDARAYVSLKFRDQQGRLIEVDRARPHALKLIVNGKDESTGLTGKGRDQTQGKIEEILGYDKQMFLNAVYIDQTIANGFVFGTQSERMNLIGKIQNLERFDDALKLVVKDIEKNSNARLELESIIGSHESDVAQYEQDIEELKNETVTDWEERRKQAQQEVAALTAKKGEYAASASSFAEEQQELDDLQASQSMWAEKMLSVRANLESLNARYTEALRLIKEKKCPRCGQSSVTAGEKMKSGLVELTARFQADRDKLKKMLETGSKEIYRREQRLARYRAGREKTQIELESALEVLAQAERGAEEEAKRNSKLVERRKKLQAKLHRARRVLKACRSTLRELDKDREIMEYAKKAFHRSGMPMYLAAALCPVLNKAAEEYSEIFFNGKIKLRFVVEDGKFLVEPVNPSGSAEVEGQSAGESAMAGIVCAFAVREISPRTNLLVMDEPGTGLDTEGAKSFARGLLKLKERFSTILVTTHHPAISGILSGEKIWKVTKQKGLSKLTVE